MVIWQKTLKSSIRCTGIGLHSGTRVTLVMHPAPSDHGIVFLRADRPGQPRIPALWSNVVDTRFCTAVAGEDGDRVGTIEHLMAALAGAEIDNLLIEIDGPEVPVMDGSAAPFLFLVECAGIVEQNAPRRAIELLRRVAIEDGERSVSLTPARGFSVGFDIDFENPLISRQSLFVELDSGSFKAEISRARTFGFDDQIMQLQRAGLARGGSLDNAVVVSGGRVLNEDGLRYDDEFVRHKALDSIGDLYLAGAPIKGHFRGVRSGHTLNNQLLRRLFANRSAWRYTTLSDQDATVELAAAGGRRASAGA
jgi:UDP-3-O-[3-hydroxymyristoyl] N-acetylglucosamine deacetylase